MGAIALVNRATVILAFPVFAAGLSSESVVSVPTREDAAEVTLSRVRPGDLVLVKGSRGIGTDLVVTRLKAEFA